MIVRRVVLEVNFFDGADRTTVVGLVRFDEVELILFIVVEPLFAGRKSSSEYPFFDEEQIEENVVSLRLPDS